MIYVISDSIGETGELVARAAASQFNSGRFDIKRIPYVTDKEYVDEIISEIKGNSRVVIVATIVLPEIKDYLIQKATELNVTAIDVMGPVMDALSKIHPAAPKLKPGLIHRLDEEYFKKVEAIEFAVKYDDGKDPRGLPRADIVLIGVSRTSKTPLSMYLAHKRLKVANVPIVPEVNPPQELFQIPSHKIIGLTISPEKLHEIRRERLKSLGLDEKANYANFDRIVEELECAENLFKKLRCRVIDVSNKAVEETASEVLQIVKNKRGI